ncbi:DUF3151 domain-containing protein [Catenuloplanes atrovinosus]|uniref:DUF3151 domain-containing protein n=1 Tax=Catenuloplanes atrovinosus TaxID=137266 RepID=A0AAE3YX17_9ACTN|nr:DUF3151 domain-containing protein [Catenuloplanes atrovinosus]MDR7280186.1 hypothetical protein [Catenuloplanes atrovinosus]
MQNLMPQPPATLLPGDDEAAAALAAADNDEAYAQVAARFPTNSAAWAALAKRAIDNGQTITGYAYARTGYHRGLDALRRNGWKGHGPVPWSHEPNRGFLACLHELARAADAIGEADEAARCAQFLRDCDPVAADALAGA